MAGQEDLYFSGQQWLSHAISYLADTRFEELLTTGVAIVIERVHPGCVRRRAFVIRYLFTRNDSCFIVVFQFLFYFLFVCFARPRFVEMITLLSAREMMRVETFLRLEKVVYGGCFRESSRCRKSWHHKLISM